MRSIRAFERSLLDHRCPLRRNLVEPAAGWKFSEDLEEQLKRQKEEVVGCWTSEAAKWEVESLARERRDCRSSSPSSPPRSTHCQKGFSPRSVFSNLTPSLLACTAMRVTCVKLLLERPTYEENCELIKVNEYTIIVLYIYYMCYILYIHPK